MTKKKEKINPDAGEIVKCGVCRKPVVDGYFSIKSKYIGQNETEYEIRKLADFRAIIKSEGYYKQCNQCLLHEPLIHIQVRNPDSFFDKIVPLRPHADNGSQLKLYLLKTEEYREPS